MIKQPYIVHNVSSRFVIFTFTTQFWKSQNSRVFFTRPWASVFFFCLFDFIVLKNRVRSLLSMRGMLLEYSSEPMPNSCVLATAGLVMTIGLSINRSLHSNKPVWREKTRLTSSEVWASAISKVWRDSGRASFSSHQALLAGWAAITLGPRGFFSRVARSFVRRSYFFSPRRMPRAAKQREKTLPDFPAFKTCFFPETGNRAWKPSGTQGMSSILIEGYWTTRT